MDYGKRIKVTFDGEIFNLNSAELITKFRLKEDAYGTYIYPTSVSYGTDHSELFLDFVDFNQSQYPLTLEYLGGTMSGRDLAVDPFEIVPAISWWNLNRHGDYEYVEVSAIDVVGEIIIAFDGNGYEKEYIEVSNIAILGTNAAATFYAGESKNYVQVSSITVSGVYCDINGIPI